MLLVGKFQLYTSNVEVAQQCSGFRMNWLGSQPKLQTRPFYPRSRIRRIFSLMELDACRISILKIIISVYFVSN